MSRLIFSELGTTPSDTDSGASQIYVKDDGKLYIKGGTGAEETLMKWTSGGSTSINYTAGNVGIGTSSPATKLHVDGAGSQPEIRVAQNGSYYADIGINHIDVVGNDLRFLFSGTEKARIKSDGKVGIGTTTPEGLLHIKHATNSTDLSANHIFGLSTGGITISAAPIAKAWVHFEGDVAAANMIKDSYNISSITDEAGGQYEVNFATNMADAFYSIAFGTDTNRTFGLYGTPSVDKFPTRGATANVNTQEDLEHCFAVVYGN